MNSKLLVCFVWLFFTAQMAEATYNAMGIGTISPSAMLDVEAANTSTASDTYSAWIQNNFTPSAAAGHYTYGIVGKSNTSGSNAITGGLTGIIGQGVVQSTQSATVSNLVGTYGQVYNQSITTVTNATGLGASVTNSSSGTITNAFGVGVAAPVNTGTITNYYGVYINQPTSATNNYALYSVGGTNYFGGYVGIGTSSPSSILDVEASDSSTTLTLVNQSSSVARYPGMNIYNYAGATGSGSSGIYNIYRANGTQSAPLTLNSGDRISSYSSAGYDGTSFSNLASIIMSAEEAFTSSAHGTNITFVTPSLGTTTRTEKMRITANGYVGIGTTSPGYNLDVSIGSVQAGSFYYSSDRALKKNIVSLTEQGSMLDKLNLLRGVSFDWKKTGEKSIGFIAQEVHEVFPELVDTRTEGHWTVQYSALIPVVVEAVKELKQKFSEFTEANRAELNAVAAHSKDIEARLNALEQENMALKQRVQALEAKQANQ